MEDFMKIVKSIEETGLLKQEICDTIKNEAKEQKGQFFSVLLGTLALIFNFEMQKYYQKKPKFNGA